MKIALVAVTPYWSEITRHARKLLKQIISHAPSILATSIFIGLGMPAFGKLQDVPGENYNFDPSTGLRWLYVVAPYDFLDFYANSGRPGDLVGWRHATADEVNYLLKSNLPSLRSAPALVPGVPNFGREATDYFVPLQVDVNHEIEDLERLLVNELEGPPLGREIYSFKAFTRGNCLVPDARVVSMRLSLLPPLTA